jgi:hypothetical protein
MRYFSNSNLRTLQTIKNKTLLKANFTPLVELYFGRRNFDENQIHLGCLFPESASFNGTDKMQEGKSWE